MSKKYQYDHNYKSEMLVAPGYDIPVMAPEFELARAYVPYQVMCRIYDPERALMKGTIFPELYRPYTKHMRDEESKG